MKLFAAIASFGLLATASVSASPYYVGRSITPSNNVTLGFVDTPTKSDSNVTGADTGNIAAFELKADYNVWSSLDMGVQLPFYMANEDAAGNSRSALGNIGFNLNWNQLLSQSTDDFQWGYSAAIDMYLPTSRKDEGTTVAYANPTTDLYLYHPRAFTAHPRAGLFIENERFYGKTNLGAGLLFIGKDNNLPADTSRTTITWQTAASWKAMPNLSANLEYNTIYMDSATRNVTNETPNFRHAVTPSVSGNYNQITGQAFVSLPLDKATRDVQTVAFGANIGYQF